MKSQTRVHDNDGPGSILLVGNFLSAHNANRTLVEDLAQRLSRSGWNVVLTSTKRSRPVRLLDMVSTAWRRRREVDVANVDVFSGQAFVWAETVCWVLRRAGTPYVLTLRGGNLPDFAKRWPGRMRSLLQSAVAVTAPSSYLPTRLHLSDRTTHVIPNGLELSRYPFKLRQRPGPNLVWLRAFHRIYNPALGPRIVALLSAEFPTMSLTMIGPDKGDGSLQDAKRVAEQLGVADRVHVLGPVPKNEVPHHLSQGDIFLNTTDADNTPVSVIEAMACGLCVVSTDVGGIPYLLEDEADSLLVPADNAEEMADAVRKVLTSPELATRLSSRAREKVEAFDWPRVVEQWERLLMSITPGMSPALRAR